MANASLEMVKKYYSGISLHLKESDGLTISWQEHQFKQKKSSLLKYCNTCCSKIFLITKSAFK